MSRVQDSWDRVYLRVPPKSALEENFLKGLQGPGKARSEGTSPEQTILYLRKKAIICNGLSSLRDRTQFVMNVFIKQQIPGTE